MGFKKDFRHSLLIGFIIIFICSTNTLAGLFDSKVFDPIKSLTTTHRFFQRRSTTTRILPTVIEPLIQQEACQPTNPSSSSPPSKTSKKKSKINHSKSSSQGSITGMISATYYVNWAIYARSHFPWEIPLNSITHVLYAFANVKPDSGEVYLTDSWADEQIHWADRGDSWNDQGNNLYGCFNQFRELKQKHRHLKLLLSIGGWTYSSNFPSATSTSAKRNRFALSSVKILEDYGLDGLDIDWEYPSNDQEADQLTDTLYLIRQELDKLHQRKNDPENSPYLLTIAAPCGPEHYKQLHLKKMVKYLSFINLMAYDYAGSWDTITGHQANLKLNSQEQVNQGNFSTQAALDYYQSQSVPSKKLVLGMPLYGRSFLNTKGIGQTFNGIGQGTWEAGVYDYKDLPRSGSKIHLDSQIVGVYSFDGNELITYDNPSTVKMKVDHVKNQNLGGVMWWESSGDKKDPKEALIILAANQLGKLDSMNNHLYYPDSKWDNLKNYKPTNEKKTKLRRTSHMLVN